MTRVLLTSALALCACRNAPEPLFELESFRLVDQRGDAYGTEELSGEVWVADFIFTTCRSVCPDLTRAMVDLDGRLDAAAPAVKLVSFTVDPKTDTPEVLSAYAKKHDATSARWRFLTGEPDTVRQVVVQNFKHPMEVQEGTSDDDALMEIAHGVRFVLVDRQSRVRGLYPIEDLDALVGDAAAL